VLARQQAISALMQASDARSELLHATSVLESLRTALNVLPDLERIATRIALLSVRPRELASLRDALGALPQLQELIASAQSSEHGLHTRLQEIAQHLLPPPGMKSLLLAAIDAEPAVQVRDGGVIATGYDAELDELRAISTDNGAYLLELEARERARTGISTLRVEFNRVHGFFIEVSRAQADKVPEDYRRRQTLKNAERYITPELKAWEDKVLSAQDRSLAREKWLFEQVLQELMPMAQALSQCASACAELDVLVALAHHAQHHDWVAPSLLDQTAIESRQVAIRS